MYKNKKSKKLYRCPFNSEFNGPGTVLCQTITTSLELIFIVNFHDPRCTGSCGRARTYGSYSENALFL